MTLQGGSFTTEQRLQLFSNGVETVIDASGAHVPSRAPAGSDGGVTVAEDGTFVFDVAGFGFSDVDGDALAGVKITTLPGAGTLLCDADGAGGATAVAVTFGQISAADIAAGYLTFHPTGDANDGGYASFAFQVRDDGVAGGSGGNIVVLR